MRELNKQWITYTYSVDGNINHKTKYKDKVVIKELYCNMTHI